MTAHDAPSAARRSLQRALFAFPVAIVLVLGLQWSEGPRDAHALGYALVLAGQAALAPALVLATLGLTRELAGRPLFGALAVLLGTLPFALAQGAELAIADGLRGRVPTPLVLVLGGVVLVELLALAVWWLDRALPASGRARIVAAGLFGVLLAMSLVSRVLSRSALALALSGAALLGAGLCEVLTFGRPRLRRAVLGVSLGLISVANLWRLSGDGFLVGRRRALVASLRLEQLDVSLGGFGPRFQGYAVVSGAPCPPQTQVPPAPALRNVVLISIDTVRADDASLVVDGRPLMPHLTRFLAQNTRATAAYTAYPATMMALVGAFTGLAPSRAVVRARPPASLFQALRGRVDRVSAILPKSKYFRRPALASYVLQGAERVPAGPDQTRAAIAHLAALRARHESHLVWVHYFEPHEPYEARGRTPRQAPERARYRSELADVDAKLGRLLAALSKQGAQADTLIAVFADHGEAFGEHGRLHHHYDLYPWLLRVPFGLSIPGAAPRAISGPVSLMDLAATVFDALGVSPREPLDGVSLLRADPAENRPIFSEEFPIQSAVLADFAEDPEVDLTTRIAQTERAQTYPSKYAVLRGHEQLVVHTASNVVELYDLATDPGCTRDLADLRPDAVRALRAVLDEALARRSASLRCAAH